MALYTAARDDRASHRGTVIEVTRSAGSPFGPSARLLADYKAGRCTWPEYEVRYREEMRAFYRRDPQEWHDFALRASLADITITCYERGDEATVRCHRRLLAGFLCAVARGDGLDITPPAVPRQQALALSWGGGPDGSAPSPQALAPAAAQTARPARRSTPGRPEERAAGRSAGGASHRLP